MTDAAWVGVAEFQQAIDAIIVAVDDVAGEAIVSKGSFFVEQAAKRHTPVKSGRLQDSIGLIKVTKLGPGRWQSETAPSGVPYERRIELGFHQADRLGRVYNQEAQPYLEQGLTEATPALFALYEREWAAAMRA